MPLWMIRFLCDLRLKQRFKDSCSRGRISQIVQTNKMFSLDSVYDSINFLSYERCSFAL